MKKSLFTLIILSLIISTCKKNEDDTSKNVTTLLLLQNLTRATATPPTSLAYSGSPFQFTNMTTITTQTPTFSGTITSCTSSPALPSGISLSPNNCALSGTPTANQTNTSYTITASSSAGSTIATISIAILVGGTVSTLAGSGTSGSTDGTGTAATFTNPVGIAIDSTGTLYLTDGGANRIRKITSTGVVTTFAGSGTAGSTDATGTAATFNSPNGIVIDSSGNIYLADAGNHKIRKITSAGVVTTFAGSGTTGSTDATGTAATFNSPTGIALDNSGNLIIADTNNNKIRKITSAGVVTTLAGSGTVGSTDATGIAATFNEPRAVVIDSSGNAYVSDKANYKIRKISSTGVVTTFAGSGIFGSSNGTSTSSSFGFIFGITMDNFENVYVADYDGRQIRKISSTGVVTTLAGSGFIGSTDGTGTTASFSLPIGISIDNSGNLYVADSTGRKVRKII